MNDAETTYKPFNMGKLVSEIATMGGTHFSHRKRARGRVKSERKPCGYCGAPGQVVNTRCEYCQVAVSR